MNKLLAKHTKLFKTAVLLTVISSAMSMSIANELQPNTEDLKQLDQDVKRKMNELDMDALNRLAKESSEKSSLLYQNDERLKAMVSVGRERALQEVSQLAEKEAAAVQHAVYENEQPVIIAVSQAMGDMKLRQLMKISSESNGKVLLVFRGFNEDQTYPQMLAKLQSMAMKFDPVPNIHINQVVFQEFAISSVPTTLIIDSETGQYSSTEKKLIYKVSGITNVSWIEEQVEKGVRGDDGVQGKTYEISEVDLSEMLRNKAANYDWKSEQEKLPKKFWKGFEANYAHLDEAIEERTRYLKPIVYAKEDIKDIKGGIIVPKGTVTNSLEKRRFDKVMIVFDASNPKQIEWLTNKLNDMSTDKRIKVLMATAFPKVNEGEDGWEKFQQLTDKLNSHVYLVQKEIIETFFIEKTPTVITANNDEHYFIIEEHVAEKNKNE